MSGVIWPKRKRAEQEGSDLAGRHARRRAAAPERLVPAAPSRIVTVYAGKGGVGKTTLSYELAYSLGAVLVDLDWDAGGASGMWGYNPRERQPRSPLVDALGSGRTPSVVTGERRPDLVPSHPDIAVNQPEPAEMRDRLAKWAVEWERPWVVVDTHPGGGAIAFGALAAASVVIMPIVLGMRELDALEGTLHELQGYPILVVPNKVPSAPPVPLVQRLETILAEAGNVPQTDVISFYPWLARRQLRVALTSYDPIPNRLGRAVGELRAVTTAVESYG
jgi:chromosome partitioning protein